MVQIKDFYFILSKIHYVPNIKSNLFSSHYLIQLKKKKFQNYYWLQWNEYLNKYRLQLFKNNKKKLFSLYTTPFKMHKSLNLDITNFNYELWNA